MNMKIRIITLALVLMSTWSWSQTNGGELSGRTVSGTRKAVGVDSTAPNRAALRVKDSTLIATLTAKDSTTMGRKAVVVTNTVAVSGTVTSTSDSTTGSRKGVVLLANPTIANTSFAVTNAGTFAVQVDSSTQRGTVKVSNTVPVTGTFWQATQPVSGTVAVSGHDSTSDSRKGVVLLVNPTVTNDSTTLSRKNVQVTNEVTTKMSTVDSTNLDLLATTLTDMNSQMNILSDNSYLYDENNNTRLGHIDTMTMNIKDSLSLIRSQLRTELNTINNSTVTALGYQDDIPLMRDTIGKIYNRIPSGLTVNSNRLAIYSPDSIRVFATNGFGSSSGGTSLDAVDSTNLAGINTKLGGTLTVGSHAVTNAGTFAVQAAQSGTWNITNVSGTVSLPTGASTEATLSTINGKIPSNLTVTSTRLLVDGSGVTQPTSFTRLKATTDTTTASLDATDSTNLAGINTKLAGTLTVGSHAVTNAGTFAVQSTNQANSGVDIGDVTINNASGASAVNIQDGGNTITVDGTVAVSGHDSTTDSRKGVVLLTTPSVQGTAAHDAALSGNPVNIGAKGITAEPTAITADRQVQLVADVVGKLITSPYANTDLFVSGSTSAITDTTSTSVIAAAGSGVRNYITSILVTNSHATVSTFVKILDGTTTLWQGYALAAGGGFSVSFPVPLRGTANTAINAKCVTTGSNVIVNCAGFKGR